MCTAVDADGKCTTVPTRTFKPTDDVYVSVKFENFVKGSNLVTRWYSGYTLIKEDSYQASAEDQGYHAFPVPAQKPYPAGSYRADVSLNANPQPTIEYQIEQ